MSDSDRLAARGSERATPESVAIGVDGALCAEPLKPDTRHSGGNDVFYLSGMM